MLQRLLSSAVQDSECKQTRHVYNSSEISSSKRIEHIVYSSGVSTALADRSGTIHGSRMLERI